MDASFIKSLQDRAEKTHARIGIGIWNADRELMASLHSAERFAELLVVGNVDESCPYEHICTDEPWRELVGLLANGVIDGAYGETCLQEGPCAPWPRSSACPSAAWL